MKNLFLFIAILMAVTAPLIIGGRNATGGHLWIITGLHKHENCDPYYYCNWGKAGKCDGWTLSTPFYGEQYDENGKLITEEYDHGFSVIFINTIPSKAL